MTRGVGLKTMKDFPTEDYGRRMLVEIINTYFTDREEKERMLELTKQQSPPVRHILTRLHEIGPRISKEHEDAICDISFLWG